MDLGLRKGHVSTHHKGQSWDNDSKVWQRNAESERELVAGGIVKGGFWKVIFKQPRATEPGLISKWKSA